MSKLTTAQAREQFSEVLNRAAYGKERIVLTRRSRDLAAVVPMEDLKLLEDLENQVDVADAQKAIQDAKTHGSIPWELVKKEKKKLR